MKYQVGSTFIFSSMIMALAVSASACDRSMVGPALGGKVGVQNQKANNQTMQTSQALPWRFIQLTDTVPHLNAALKSGNAADKRYIDLTHIYNARSDERLLRMARASAGRAVNSVSRSPQLHVPVAINPEATILEISLRALGWDQGTWESIVADYPYAVVLSGQEFSQLKAMTGSAVPLVRVDWLVRKIMTPSEYYRLLGMPDNLGGLEQMLGISLLNNVRSRQVMRAGYSKTKISEGSRVIERHQTSSGQVWRSYEFAASTAAAKDVIRNPLGPRAANLSSGRAFDEDGGEFIFTLPNGLLGFFVAGKDGQRMAAAPEVTFQGRTFSPAVAINCMECHSRGMIFTPGEVSAASFSGSEASLVAALYPGNPAVEGQISRDSNLYKQALVEFGEDLDDRDVVVTLYKFYEAEVSSERLAAELYLEQAPAIAGGSRQEIENAFTNLWRRAGR